MQQTSKFIKIINYELADSFFSRARGLMFRFSPKTILFIFPKEGIHPIHSLFVFFPFDAVYLDAQMRVTEIFRSVPPFTLLISPKKPAKYLLELPAGDAEKLSIKVGTKLQIL